MTKEQKERFRLYRNIWNGYNPLDFRELEDKACQCCGKIYQKGYGVFCSAKCFRNNRRKI